MSEPVRLDAVRFAWGSAPPLLDGLSFEAEAGGITALVGASGCGKSTVLRLVAGMLRPSAGSVAAPGRERAFVFQTPTLLPWRSVAENVALPLELGRVAPEERRRRVDEALGTVGLSEAAELLPRQLSGGMKMRASLARAMVTRPDLLLMDEPWSALDPLTRRRLQQEFLAMWTAARFTVLLVTHDLDEAVLMADRVIVLGGRPASVRANVPIPLPRPRSVALLHDPALGRLSATLEAAL